MGDATVDTSQVSVSDNGAIADSGSSGVTFNPAWNDLLGTVPNTFHASMAPHLHQWDKNYSGIQDKLKSYEGLGSLEDLTTASDVYKVLSTNPRAVYDRLVETFGNEWGLNSTKDPVVGPPDEGTADFSEFKLEENPKFQELVKNNDVLAQYLYSQMQQQQQAEADRALDQELSSLKSSKGDFNEKIVLSLAHTYNMPLEEAVNMYFEQVGAVNQQQSKAATTLPPILPTNGSMPANIVDIASLGKADTRKLALEYLGTSRGK